MKYPNIDPVIINIYGPIALRWYSLAYISGLVATMWFLKRELKEIIEVKKLDSLVNWIIIGMLTGARITYTMVYNFKHYISNPLEILYIWEGGLSFHGGVIGIFIGTLIFGHINKVKYYQYIKIIDTGIIMSTIGIFFGRIANFINGELWGRECHNSSFCTIFPSDPLQLPRHPSQLYEASTEGLLLFLILFLIYHNTKLKNKPGVISGLFGMLYAVFRFIIEYFREPDAQVGFLFFHLTMGQILSIIMFFASIIWIVFHAVYSKNKTLN